jgi:hypothetical protein
MKIKDKLEDEVPLFNRVEATLFSVILLAAYIIEMSAEVAYIRNC